MALDPMLFKRFHKPGSDVAVPPRPASPPPAKEKGIVDVIKEAGFEIAFDIPAKEPTVEGGGSAPETHAEQQDVVDDTTQEEVPEVEPKVEEPIDSKEVAIFVQPKEDAGPAFKATLDKLDALVQSELGISPYTIDVIRGHVKQIMLDLVTQPELDSILIDRDVHNVLAFIRHVKVDAVEARESTKTKKVAKAAKDSKFKNFDLDLTALSAALGGDGGGNNGLPKSLEDLSKLK